MKAISLKGKRALVVGVGDDQGYGWAIAKALCEAGATVSLGVWVPLVNIFRMAWNQGRYDESRQLEGGGLFEFDQIYPIDANYSTPDEVPEEVRSSKRYQNHDHYTLSEVKALVEEKEGKIDILIHALANAPEIKLPLLETSRAGYLAALGASSYSLIALVKAFASLLSDDGAVLSLSYIASDRVIPGYGGGMSSAKAALESDIRVLAYELGKRGCRINAISAGPYPSRAAKAIGFIESMVNYSQTNAPLHKKMTAEEVGNMALVLCSSWASAITGSTVYVDNGLHVMGVALDSQSFQ